MTAFRGRRRRPAGVVVLAVALLVAGGALAAVAARGPAGPRTLQDRVEAIASGIKCPVCEDMSVADSPSALAVSMRGRIATELQRGETPAQIRDGFVRSYGDWILLTPPARGFDLTAWILPFVLLLAGLGAAVLAVRRWSPPLAASSGGDAAAGAEPDLAPSDRALLDRAMSELAAGEEPE